MAAGETPVRLEVRGSLTCGANGKEREEGKKIHSDGLGRKKKHEIHEIVKMGKNHPSQKIWYAVKFLKA